MYKVLTIAGSDSSGGAGIQADLKTFFARSVYGMTVVTAVTAQNTVGVQGIVAMSAKFVGLQIDSVMSDIGCTVWKTGMLATSDIVKTVAQKVKQYNIKLLVVDPVMIAASGTSLLNKNAINVLIKKLLPLAFVVTPNIPEAESLTGNAIKTLEDMKKAALAIHKLGAANVVVKGGHLSSHVIARSKATRQSKKDPHGLRPQDDITNQAIDILFDGKRFHEFRETWVHTHNTHGTGCTFASCIAAEIAKGTPVQQAVHVAKNYVTDLLGRNKRMKVGKGAGPVFCT